MFEVNGPSSVCRQQGNEMKGAGRDGNSDNSGIHG